MNLVLTGPIRAGKSTIVRRVMEKLRWRKPAGFFTRADPDQRPATTLMLETWTGEAFSFARRIETVLEGAPSYEVDLNVFEHFAVHCLESAGPQTPVVLDELGVMELRAERFIRAVSDLFHRPGPVLAVIQARALDRWMTIIGRERVNHLLLVDEASRDTLPDRIAALFCGR